MAKAHIEEIGIGCKREGGLSEAKMSQIHNGLITGC
jgi:hypothetical protein